MILPSDALFYKHCWNSYDVYMWYREKTTFTVHWWLLLSTSTTSYKVIEHDKMYKKGSLLKVKQQIKFAVYSGTNLIILIIHFNTKTNSSLTLVNKWKYKSVLESY